MNGHIGRGFVWAATTCIALLVGTGTALAHIDPDPPAIERGTSATVGFGVEHGCDGSPTVGLDVKVPDGVTDAQAVAKDGWTTSVANGVVSFSGGSLDAEEPASFSITFTAPTTAGTIFFPVVQKCAAGETAWIAIPVAGGAEPDHPAPAILITDGPPTADDLAGHADDDEETTGTESAVVVDTVTTSSSDDGGSSNTGVIIGVIVGVAIAGGVAGAVFVRRNKHTPST